MSASATKGSLLGGIFLVAGTAIGGGMLALPVLTANGGFWPTTFFYFLCWLFMASTGHLLMEVTLWMKKGANIVSMAESTLGKVGKIAAWLLYIFLFYSLTAAYIAGGGNLIGYAYGAINKSVAALIFVLLCAPFVILGARTTDKINSLFVWGLLITFIVFLVMGLPYIDAILLKRASFSAAFTALPVLFTSFGFQGIVPTLTYYFGQDAKRTALAIWIGSFIPLVTYIVWEALILGVVPLSGLEMAESIGETAVYPLKDLLSSPSLFFVGKLFAFFAIITSFFGVTLGLIDFLSDGLNIANHRKNRFFLGLLVFIPPLFMALISPCLFLNALRYGGGVGCTLLLGLLPILMVWRGRYNYKQPHSPFALPGGKSVLLLLSLFVIVELMAQIKSVF